MSKKCCGMIYSDDEKVCKVCGKPLADAEEIEDETDDVTEADEKAETVEEPEEDEEEISTISYDSGEDLSDSDKEPDEASQDEEPEEKKVDYLKKHIEREAILDQIYDDNSFKKNDRIKEDREKVPFKGAGIFMLILAILGLFVIGALVYFIVVNPYYIKSGESDKKLNYPELASVSDAEEMSTLLEPYNASETDAEAALDVIEENTAGQTEETTEETSDEDPDNSTENTEQ